MRRTLVIALLLVTGTSAVALAELFGPLGKVMHSMMQDLDCLEDPSDFLCDGTDGKDLVADMITQAQTLHDNPAWVTNLPLVKPADAAAVVTKAQELLDLLKELQVAVESKDKAKQASLLKSIEAVKKAAHAAFKAKH
ncbi:MAG TPA: hypothetical protein VL588_10905 [Bdellovibrionota bacterium]|nr:hypothetical protein [Bdellovibrionota bacterium]